MATYYRNRTTGIIQSHPQSGIGDSLNSDEIGQDGKPLKPHTSLAPSVDEVKRARDLITPKSNPLTEALASSKETREKTTARKPVSGNSKQEGAD